MKETNREVKTAASGLIENLEQQMKRMVELEAERSQTYGRLSQASQWGLQTDLI
jgi:hypothetical protein